MVWKKIWSEKSWNIEFFLCSEPLKICLFWRDIWGASVWMHAILIKGNSRWNWLFCYLNLFPNIFKQQQRSRTWCIRFHFTFTSFVIERLPVPPLTRKQQGDVTESSRAFVMRRSALVASSQAHSQVTWVHSINDIIDSVSCLLGSPLPVSSSDRPRVDALTGSTVHRQVQLPSDHYQSHGEGHNITPARCSHFLVASITERSSVEADHWSLPTLTPH